MKTVLRVIVPLLLLLSPTVVSAQSVVFVVDVGPARLDVDAIRERVGAEADRPLVRLGDEASRSATETLTIANAGEGRWVFRYQRGIRERWLERTGVSAETLTQVLTAAAIELLRGATPEPAPEPTARVVQRESLSADEYYGTRAGHDLVDPFANGWDPLRTAVDGEIMRPFIGRGGMVYVGVADPFARETTAVHLLDPWSR